MPKAPKVSKVDTGYFLNYQTFNGALVGPLGFYRVAGRIADLK